MKIFKCEKCEKCFNKKYDYETHLNKKKSCVEDLKIVNYKQSLVENSIHCEFCNQCFKSNRDLIRHLNSKNTCFSNRTDNKFKKAYIETLNLYNNNIGKLEVNNKIKPVKFRKRGKERVDHITRDVVLELFKNQKFILICEELMKLIYFNEKVPENSSWSIAYPKNDTAGVVYNDDDDDFERRSTKQIVEDKFSNMINLLVPVMQSIHKDVEFYETLSDIQQVNMVNFFYHLGMYQISKESPDVYEAMHKLCYAQRKIPMKLWSEQGYSGSHLSLKFG
jgi:uncharacterized C2H2 Zn-finger protein